MDRSRRGPDHVLLGLSPRDPFSGGDVPRKPPVDFSDVFGGPPRRFCGPGDNAGAFALGGGGVEGDGEHSRRWSSSVADKPVFGSPAHRRHLGDDFFGDIFRGNESACPTPRRKDLDLLSPSSPASRVLSPARPLPPTGDVFRGDSSLPAHLSYSSRLAKSFDYSSFRSSTTDAVCKHEERIPDAFSIPSSPNVCAPATPSRLIRIKDYLIFGNHAGNGADETEKQLHKAPTASKAYSRSGHYHFSIYKWASKGVTLLMPPHFKERAKSRSSLSAVSSQVLPRADLPPDNENVPQGAQAFQNENEIEDKSLFNHLASAESDNMGSSKEMTEPSPPASDLKSVLCDNIANTSGTCIEDRSYFSEEEGKPESNNHHHLINANSEREGGNEGIPRQAKRKESFLSDCKTVMKDGDDIAKIKRENGANTIFGCTVNVSQDMHDTLAILEDKVLPGRTKGKVTDFIKLFNQEAVQKTSGTVENRARRPKVKDVVQEREEGHASARVAAAYQEVNSSCGEATSTPMATSQGLRKAEQKTSIKSSDMAKLDGSFPEIIATSGSLSDTTLGRLDASFCSMEEAAFDNVEECMMEEFSEDQNEVRETDLRQDVIEIKMLDTKIQEWSKGKEGNIRSLLSTLQYVLWPGSGWKPVPLVDIVEGASVRRAYQRALLCLHPDKLQQKGAETNHKYIAEKVFEILQEAWSHFSSLSSL